jgi:D-arginine dehydrogenase
MTEADIVIIGGGIAGVSLAARLAGHARVVLLEREDVLAYHTTGRSAAVYSEAYGNERVRQWTREGRGFFENPPPGFTEVPLISPRPVLYVARAENVSDAEQLLAENPPGIVRAVTPAEAEARMPILRKGEFAAFVEEPGAQDIDVAALFEGFRRMALHGGTDIRMNREVHGVEHGAGGWTVSTPGGEFAAPILVNAAGAWGGMIGAMAGLGDAGLTPLRRTAVTIEPPPGVDVSGWMHVNDIAETFYFKPEAGLILASPVDETPSPPCDAQPEEIDVARIAHEIERATTMNVTRIRRRWAGLRTFTPNRTPRFEFDPRVPGFFWLVGQGGYGMQTAPAISERAARLIRDRL